MQETIGQCLKQIRLSRHISLEKAAEATRVRAHYLQALESDNYSVMSSAAQSRGFLRLYADYLGLDLEAAMNELRQDESVDVSPVPVSSAPVTEPSEPNPVPETLPASLADGKPVRRPFWSRLLRRDAPKEPAIESGFSSEPADAKEFAPAPAVDELPAPVISPEPESMPMRVRKPAAKKAKTSAKISKPKTVKSKTAVKPAAPKNDKKKASLKNKSSKKRQ